MTNEVINPTATDCNSLAPALKYVGNKIRVKFEESCLKQDKITYAHGAIVNIYNVYEFIPTLNYFDPTLETFFLVQLN